MNSLKWGSHTTWNKIYIESRVSSWDGPVKKKYRMYSMCHDCRNEFLAMNFLLKNHHHHHNGEFNFKRVYRCTFSMTNMRSMGFSFLALSLSLPALVINPQHTYMYVLMISKIVLFCLFVDNLAFREIAYNLFYYPPCDHRLHFSLKFQI